MDEWMEDIKKSLESIESLLAELGSIMEKMLERIVLWHDDDNIHHKEENSLIKQMGREHVKDKGKGTS